nr:MAG TPA: protein of unknown function DUF5016 [Bacteriophage sp.]
MQKMINNYGLFYSLLVFMFSCKKDSKILL